MRYGVMPPHGGGGSSGEDTFVYRCTGVDDDLAIQNIVNDFFANGMALTMSLLVTGTMGLQVAPVNNRHIAINSTNTRGAVAHLDFGNCEVPQKVMSRHFFNHTGNGSIFVSGLTMTNARYFLVSQSTGKSTFISCTFIDGTISVSAVTSNSFINCIFITDTGGFGGATGSSNVFIDCVFYTSSINAALVLGGGYTYFSHCLFNSAVSNYSGLTISGGNNNFNNCAFSGTGVGVGISAGDNAFNNCTFTNTGMYAVYLNGGGNNKFTSCNINITGTGIYVSVAVTGGILVLLACKIIAATGVTVETTSVTMEIKLIGCEIKGTTTQDINQTTAASTVKWHVMGNSFSRATVVLDGTVAISSKTASAHIYFPQYANQFSRTIT